MTFFHALSPAPPDAILGLSEAFQKDPNPNKINLSVGVYKDESGVTPVLESVKQAERRWWELEKTKSYLPIDGLTGYNEQVQRLLFSDSHTVLTQQRAATVQTPGGTGALRVAADFLRKLLPDAAIWCSKPTWANHPGVFSAAGLTVNEYRYLHENGRDLDFAAMLEDLQAIPTGDVVVLHGCCHNPSGADPSLAQWTEIATLLAQRGLMPLVDFAYQGFADGLEQDRAGLLEIAARVDEFWVASSYSKNFGLYRERVGALTAVLGSAQAADAVRSHVKKSVRTNYSNPPAHGGAIVQTILDDEELTQLWQSELEQMRQRIHQMRSLFVQTMRALLPDHAAERAPAL